MKRRTFLAAAATSFAAGIALREPSQPEQAYRQQNKTADDDTSPGANCDDSYVHIETHLSPRDVRMEFTFRGETQDIALYDLLLQYTDRPSSAPRLDWWDLYGFDETDGHLRIEPASFDQQRLYFADEPQDIEMRRLMGEELVHNSELLVSEIQAVNGDRAYAILENQDFLRLEEHESYMPVEDAVLIANSPEDAIHTYLTQ